MGLLERAANSRKVWLGLLAAFAIAFPFLAPGFYVTLLVELLVASLFAVSFNLVFGHGGMISIGHAAFYGVGAYSTAILLKNLAVPLPLALLAGMLLAALVGVVIAYFSIRLTGFYLAFLTLAFAQLVYVVIWKWYDLTGGDNGIVGVPVPSLISSPQEPWRFYYFTLVLVAVSLSILWRITNSPFGSTLRACRDNLERTEFIGVNVMACRLLAFVISALFSGLAGGLMALSLGGAFPDFAHWTKSAEVTLMALLGGMFTFSGPIVGAGLMVLLKFSITRYTEYWMIFMGPTLVLAVIFVRQGIVGFLQEKFQAMKLRYGLE